jgi:RND family efflux transporter MFP subunit
MRSSVAGDASASAGKSLRSEATSFGDAGKGGMDTTDGARILDAQREFYRAGHPGFPAVAGWRNRRNVTQVTDDRRPPIYRAAMMDDEKGIRPGRLLVGVALLALMPLAAAQTVPVTASVVEYRDLERLASTEGVVEAVRRSTLAAQVAGRIMALPVRAGDAVKAGQLLVQIDSRSALQAEVASQSQVREAQANLANAQSKFERSKRLFEQKFISGAALDQAKAEYLAAQAQAAGAAALAGQSATSKSFTTIVAPYDGVVASTEVEVGDMATVGRPLVTVFDPRELRVTATLPQAVLALAKLDAPVRVDVPTLGRELVARRVTVIPVADARTHTTQVRLDLPQADGLMPGQYAKASIVIGRARALAIPQAAVLRRSEVTAVYVLVPEGAAQLRQVRLGEAAGNGLVEVLAGLSAGERVALEPVRTGIEASKRANSRS